MAFLLVALGGAFGAPLRYLIDRAWHAPHVTLFPWGTFSASTLACGLLGFVSTLVLPEPWFGFVAVGFLGALSTYSTFAFDTVRLARGDNHLLALANAAISLLAGAAAALIGAGIGRTLG